MDNQILLQFPEIYQFCPLVQINVIGSMCIACGINFTHTASPQVLFWVIRRAEITLLHMETYE